MNINYNTESIKYLGSKKEILPFIWKILKNEKIKTVFDGFSGSTRVSQFFKNNNMNVISNDLNIWSLVIGDCYLNTKKEKSFYEKLIKDLNNLKGEERWYSKTYGGVINENNSSIQSDNKKRIWQLHITKKLDVIRDTIDVWFKNNIIDKNDKNVLLTSLILALDKVDNTMGHQVSYLKEWSKRSSNELILKVPNFIINKTKNKIYNEDTMELLKNKKIKADLFYFDPPYGSSNDKMPSSRVRYGQYYHIWTTIILNDKPKVIGKINKRNDATVENTYSIFEEYKKDENEIFLAEKAIENLFLNSVGLTKNILFSYNTNSRVPIKNIENILIKNKFKYTITYINYKKNVMANMNTNKKYNTLEKKENKEVLIFINF